jgi:hypothetical protein
MSTTSAITGLAAHAEENGSRFVDAEAREDRIIKNLKETSKRRWQLMHEEKRHQELSNMVEAFGRAIPANSLPESDPSEVWIIGSILPKGVTILQGGPLIGKTWLALKLGLAVADPEHSNGLDVVKSGTVLYIRYESSESEVRERLEDLFPEEILPSRLMVLGDWPTAGKGLRTSKNAGVPFKDTLRAAKTAHPDLVLVIIDTVVHFSPAIVSRNYELAKILLREVKEACEELGVSVLFVHHTSKQSVKGSPSPYSGLGTMAVSGGAGSIIDLRLDEKNDTGILTLFSHYVGKREMVYRIAQDGSGFEIKETVFDTHMTAARVQILGVFASDPKKLYRPSDISAALEKDIAQSTPRTLLNRLLKLLYLEKADRGLYRITERGLKAYAAHLFLLGEEKTPVALEPTKPVEPSAQNPVVIEDAPVIEPVLEAGSLDEATSATPTEADAPEGSSPGDHGGGNEEEAGPSSPPLPSEIPDGSTGPEIEGSTIVRPRGRFDADRPSAEAKRDALGIRLSKMPSPQGSSSPEAYRDSLGRKYLDSIYRSPNTLVLHLDDPLDWSDLADRPALAKVFGKYPQEKIREALDLWVTFADLKLWACRCDQNRKIQLLPVGEDSLPVPRPDGKPCYQTRHDNCPEILKERLADLELPLCLLMGEDPWAEITAHLMSDYLSVWESERIFENLHKKGRSGRTGTGLKPAELTHVLLIQRQSFLEIQAPDIYLASCPEKVAYPLRRRQIRESLGLPTWPGDRTAR